MAEDLGEAKVRLRLDSSSFKGDLNKGVKDPINSVAASAKSAFSGALKGFGVGLGALGLLKFAKDSVASFSESEQAALKLQSAFEKFPTLGDSSAKAFEEINKGLQLHTKFSDEDFAAAEANLAQFKLTGAQLKELIPLTADYAARTGQDLVGASTSLGKALLGNTRALKSIGINFKITGDRAKDAATLMGLLSGAVGGFAEKQGKSAAGQLAILNNQFDELKETVGKAVVPALVSAAHVVTPLLTVISKVPPQVFVLTAAAVGLNAIVNKVAASTLGKTVPAVGTLASFLGKAGLAAAAASVAFDAFFGEAERRRTLAGEQQGQAFIDRLLPSDANIAKAQGRIAELKKLIDDKSFLPSVPFFHQLTEGDTQQVKQAEAEITVLQGFLKGTKVTYDSLGRSVQTTASKQNLLLSAYKGTSDALSHYNDLLNATLNPIIASQEAADALEKSQKALNEAYARGSGIFKGSTDAAEANRSTLRGVVKDTLAHIEAQVREGKIGANATNVKRHEVAALKALKAQYPALSSQIDVYIGAIGKIPVSKGTRLFIVGLQAALADVSILGGALDRLAAHSISLSDVVNQGPHRATGGTADPTRVYTVGENRPEQFRPDRPGVVRPDPGALPGRNHPGGNHYEINVFTDSADPGVIARAVRRQIAQNDTQQSLIDRTG